MHTLGIHRPSLTPQLGGDAWPSVARPLQRDALDRIPQLQVASTGLALRIEAVETGLTRSKQFQIDSYFETIQKHAETLSADRMFIDAAREFRAAYRKLDAASIPADTQAAVRVDYQESFYPEMQKLKLARPHVEDYLPTSPAALELQYLYIVRNPHPPEHRNELANAGDGSDYSRVHEKYHGGFRHLIESFDYSDLYLIDYETGKALYDVFKDRDFGTDLLNGPSGRCLLLRL